MRIEDLDLGERWSARLVENMPLTPPEAREEVRELLLETLAPGPDLRIGQNVAVLVTGPHDFGQRQHVRLYTLASTPDEAGPGRFSLCVRRCSYLDPYSGERFPGIASNYLCDLPAGSELLLAGPVGLPFAIPADPHTPLLAVGLGTGIAPFRGLLREVFEKLQWRGKVMLFHGARAGVETAYIRAITAIAATSRESAGFAPVEVRSPRPAWDDPADLVAAVRRHQADVWALLSHPDIHVYLAGQARIGQQLDAALGVAAGGAEAWAARKAEISDAGRWMALLY
jgi:ferredoxin--NADP+ reductase